MKKPLTVAPGKVRLQDGGEIDSLDIHLAYGELSYTGKLARLILYDYPLYDAYRKEASSGYADPSDFREPRKTGPLPIEARDPDFEHPKLPTGVLLKLNGVLHKDASENWCWGPIEAVEPPDKSGRGLRVRVHQKVGRSRELRHVGTAYYRKVDLPRLKQGKLAVRILLLDTTPGLDQGSVIGSSLCGDHCPNPNLIPITDGAFGMMNAEIGGSGGKKPRKPPAPQDRTLPNDLSGIYMAEHPDGSEYLPPLCMQVNQAGHALVGWFQKPHPDIVVKLRDREGPDIPHLPIDEGCFACELKPGEDTTYIDWDVSSGHIDPIPASFELGKNGYLRHLSGAPDDVEQKVRLTLFDEDKSVELDLIRRQYATRTSWWVFEKLKKSIPGFDRHILRFSEMEPILDEYFEYLKSQVTDENPKIIDALEKWVGTSDAAEKRIANQTISNILMDVLPSPIRFHREVISRVRAFMASSFHRDPSILAWMHRLGADQLDRARKAIHPSDPGSVDPRSAKVEALVLKGFWKYGFLDGDDFRYTFKFSETGASFLIGSLGSFVVTIKKEKKERKEEGGKTTTQYVDVTEAEGFKGVEYAGAFAGYGVNAGLKVKLGGAAPGGVAIPSAYDLKPLDFEGAWFGVTTLASGQVNTPATDFDLFKSALLEIWSDEFALSAETTNVFNAKIHKPRKGFGIDVSWMKIGRVTGHFTVDYGLEGTEFDEDTPPDPNDKSKSVSTELLIQVMFNKDDSQIQSDHLTLLEKHLAVFRKLVETEQGSIRTFGYASPEGRVEYNHNLSAERALAVLQATRGALGDAILVPESQQSFDGKGEDAAKSVGKLTDPPPHGPNGEWQFPSTMSPEDRKDLEKKLRHEEHAYWPAWRMVWMVLTGVMAMRVTAK